MVVLAVIGRVGEVACEGGFIDVFLDDFDAEPVGCALCNFCRVILSVDGLWLLVCELFLPDSSYPDSAGNPTLKQATRVFAAWLPILTCSSLASCVTMPATADESMPPER